MGPNTLRKKKSSLVSNYFARKEILLSVITNFKLNKINKIIYTILDIMSSLYSIIIKIN